MKRLYLGEPTIFERTNKNVVSDGLACYSARSSASGPWEYAIKLKWSPAGEKSEAKMLGLVKERNPVGSAPAPSPPGCLRHRCFAQRPGVLASRESSSVTLQELRVVERLDMFSLYGRDARGE